MKWKYIGGDKGGCWRWMRFCDVVILHDTYSNFWGVYYHEEFVPWLRDAWRTRVKGMCHFGILKEAE